MTSAKFVIRRTTKNQVTTFVKDPPAKTRSFVRAFLLERSSSSISTNPPGRNIARNTPEESKTYGCPNVEVGQPCSAEPASQPLHPAVEDAGSEHEIVRLYDDSVFVGFQKYTDDENS